MKTSINYVFMYCAFALSFQVIEGNGQTSSFSLLRGWYTPGNGFQYKITRKTLNYAKAHAECQGWGGSLAQHGIRDRFYFPKLAGKFSMPVWVGLEDRRHDGRFHWTDERPITHGWNNAWAFLQPNYGTDEDCVVMTSQPCKFFKRGLHDVQCNEKHFGLCERSIGNPPQYKSTIIGDTEYTLITVETRYHLAKQQCLSWGGQLAEKPVTNSMIAEILVDTLYNNTILRTLNSWVGMTDVKTEGILTMESEKEISYVDINWMSERNSQEENCGTFNPHVQGKILLEPCDIKRTVLCEKPIPQPGQEKPSSCLQELGDCEIGSYRSINGHCRNLLNADRGREKRPFKRMLPPVYDDGEDSPRGGFPSRLPSPRKIIRGLNDSVEAPSSFASHHMPLWGQFLAHDLTKLGELKDKNGALLLPCPCDDPNPNCFNIPIPDEDPVREELGCYSFIRAEKVPDINCANDIRAQENRVTSYLDASNVYGSNQLFFSSLRGENGMLMTGHYQTSSHYNHLPLGTQVIPEMQTQFECEAIHFDFTDLPCMAGGDIRANEHAALASGHTTWMRKHNQIASTLNTLNPSWDGDKTFYPPQVTLFDPAGTAASGSCVHRAFYDPYVYPRVTRSIIAAIHQQITYNEFFPVLLGEANMKRFGLKLTKKGFYYGFDSSYDATIDISFATAALRLGHTLINGILSRPRTDYSDDPDTSPIDLASQFFDPVPLYDKAGMGSVLRGMVSDHAMNYDTQFANALTNHLFAKAGEFGKDLPSINIQRARDHGIPSYMEHRRFCGLSTTTDCRQMEDIPLAVRKKLCRLYNSTEDIDIFVGGIAEVPRNRHQGIPGPTFACLIAYQARDLKKGDPYWFENGGSEAKFTFSQLEAIKKVTLARIICDVGENITSIQPRAMLQPTVEGNERVPCSRINSLDLFPFQEIGSGFVETEPDFGNAEEDYEWTAWFPYSISSKQKIPLKPAPVLLRHLQVYRPDETCTDIIGTETKIVNGYYQIRYKCYPGSIKATDFPPVDSEEVYWTKWSNQATPVGPYYNEDENIDGSGACIYPVAIQAQTITGIPARETGDVFEVFSPWQGLLCKGIHQPSNRCHDYKIRFLCLKD